MPGGKKKKNVVQSMEQLNLRDSVLLSIWTDGAAKDNHIAGAGSPAGVGVVFGDPSLPYLYGPVQDNLTEKATNNAAELQAAILGLEQAQARNYKEIKLNTDSKLLKNIMTKWLDQWKRSNWIKSDGDKPKNLNLVKKLDGLRSELKITWNWIPRNSCFEMVLADKLANLACESAIESSTLHGEKELNPLFRRTMYDRRIMYPDELPPTVLRCKDLTFIPATETCTVTCTLDISERLKQKLIGTRAGIQNMTSDQAYGLVTMLRTCDPIEADGTVVAQCHNIDATFEFKVNREKKLIEPTLVLPQGSIVGLAYSGGGFAADDGQMDKGRVKMMFWTPKMF